MGNTNSRSFEKNSELYSKSIPNIRTLSDESEQFYFAHALKLQEQFSMQKNLRLQNQLSNNNFHLINKHKSVPDQNSYIEYSSHTPISNLSYFNYLNTSNEPDFRKCSGSVKLKKSSKKLNKFFKLGNQTVNNNNNNSLRTSIIQGNDSKSSLPRANNRKNSMTKSLIIIDSNNKAKSNHMMNQADRNDIGENYLSLKNRTSIGNRLSAVENFKSIDDNLRPGIISGNTRDRNHLGSIELNKSIDLNESNLIDSAKYKYIGTKNSMFNNSNNSSSSGCSSGASSSNLSTSRRISQRPDSVLSNWSTNKMSTPSPPPSSNEQIRSEQKNSLKKLALKNHSGASTGGPILKSASSAKSILSDTTSRVNDDSLLTKCSTPLDGLSNQLRNFSYLNGMNVYSSKSGAFSNTEGKQPIEKFHNLPFKKQNEASIDKCESVNSINSILVMKPCSSKLQSSLSSTGVSSSCGFVSSEASSISNSKAENSNLNYTGSVRLSKRGQNRFNQGKSKSMYVRDPAGRHVSSPETSKKLNKKTKKQRDSGILVDLFNINGSVSNLKAKFSNATSSLRNSFSTFTLRNLSIKKSSKSLKRDSKAKSNHALNIPVKKSQRSHYEESDLDIDNEYENSDDNYNSHSEEDDSNENSNDIYNLPGIYDYRKSFDKYRSEINSFTPKELHMISSASNDILNRQTLSESRKTNDNCSTFKSHANCINLENDYDTIEKSPNTFLKTNSSYNRDLIIQHSSTLELNNNLQHLNRTDTSKSYKNHSIAKTEIEKPRQTMKVISNEYPNVPSQRNEQHLMPEFSSTNNSIDSIKYSNNKIRSNLSQNHSKNDNENLRRPNLPTFTAFKALETHLKNTNKNLAQNTAQTQPSSNSQTSFRNSEFASLNQKANAETSNDKSEINSNPRTVQHKKIVVQASTNDLLSCFAQFVAQKCSHLAQETYINPLCYMNDNIGKRIKFDAKDTINWLRSADCSLLIQGWQEIAFMNPVNVVFVYLLVRDTLRNPESMRTVYDLQCNIMACLYLAFSYMGNEISYPLKPFLIEENRSIFWQRICDLMNKLSSNMLRINRDPRYFTELFYELKSYATIKKSITSAGLSQIIKNPSIDIKSLNRKSSFIQGLNNVFEQNDKSIKSDKLKHNQTDDQLEGKVSLFEASGLKNFSTNKNYCSSQNLNYNEPFASTNSPLCMFNSKKKAEFNNERSKSFYKSFEQTRPNHQVIFSSNDPQPVPYCI